MVYKRTIETEFISTGADKIIKDQERVGASFNKAGRSADTGAASVNNWVQRHTVALTLMAAAGAAVMGGIIKSSPLLSAALASTRLAFSLLAGEIGDNVEPMFALLEEASWQLLAAWDGLSPGTQQVISYFIVLGATSLILTAALAGVIAIVVTLGVTLVIAAAIIGSIAVAVTLFIVALDTLGNKLNWLWGIFALAGPPGWAVLTLLILIQKGMDALGIESISVSGFFEFWLDVLKTVIGYIQTTAIVVFNAFKFTIEQFGMAVSATWNWLSTVGISVMTFFGDVVKNTWEMIKLVIATIILAIYYLFTGQWGKLGELFEAFGEKFIAIWSGVWDIIKSIFSSAFSFIGDAAIAGFDFISDVFWFGLDALVSIVTTMASAIKEAFLAIIDPSFWTNLASNMWNFGSDMVKSLIKGIGNVGKKVFDWFTSSMKSFVSWLVKWAKGVVGMSPTLIQIGMEMIKSLFSFVGEAGSMAWDLIKGFVGGLMDAVSGLASSIMDIGSDIAGWIGDGISGALDTLSSLGGDIVDAVKGGASAIMDFAGDAWDWGSDMASNFGAGVVSGAKKIGGAVSSAAKGVKDFFSFDIPENDRWAFESGADMVKFFQKGVTRASESLATPGVSPQIAAATPSLAGGGNVNRSTNINIERIIVSGGGSTISMRELGDETGRSIDRRLSQRGS